MAPCVPYSFRDVHIVDHAANGLIPRGRVVAGNTPTAPPLRAPQKIKKNKPHVRQAMIRMYICSGGGVYLCMHDSSSPDHEHLSSIIPPPRGIGGGTRITEHDGDKERRQL